MIHRKIPKSHVCKSLDEALQFAEEVLIARTNPMVFQCDYVETSNQHEEDGLSVFEEAGQAASFLEKLACSASIDYVEAQRAVPVILSRCRREEFKEDEIIWTLGSCGDNMKLLVSGRLVASMPGGSHILEVVKPGSLVGELGLVQGSSRLSTLKCCSERAVTYTLDRTSWEKLLQEDPKAARVIDYIVILYLFQRVQHVSNRIFETRCLPI